MCMIHTMNLDDYRGYSEDILKQKLRESKSFPERRRIRAALKELAAKADDRVVGTTDTKVVTSIFWTPNTVSNGHVRKNFTGSLVDLIIVNSSENSFSNSSRPLARCTSYKSTLHIDLSQVNQINGISQVSMAATTGQSRSLVTNNDHIPNLDRRRSSAALGTYCIIRRSSQMLSDSGPLLPRTSSISSSSSTSPLLQIASDINESLITLKQNTIAHKLSTESLSDTNKTNTKPTKIETVSQISNLLSSSNSLLGANKIHPSSSSLTDQSSTTTITNSILYVSPQNVETEHKSQNATLPLNTSAKNSKDSVDVADDNLEPMDGLPPEIRRGDSSFSEAFISADNSLERRRKSKMFSDLREMGRQLLSESGAYASANAAASPTHSDSPDEGFNAATYLNTEGQTDQAETDQMMPEPRAKSKFLSSLYSGQEKIKSFINKGKNQLKAHELSLRLNHRQPTGHLETLAREGSRVSQRDQPVTSDCDPKSVNDTQEEKEREINSYTASSSGGLSSANDTHETNWIGGKGARLTATSLSDTDKIIPKSLPTGDVTPASEHSVIIDNRGECLDLAVTGKYSFSQNSAPCLDSWSSRPSSSSDDVFSPISNNSPVFKPTPVKAILNVGEDSNFEPFELPHLKRPYSLSPASSASSSRCGTPTLSSSGRSAFDLARVSGRRFSLPDVMEAKKQVQGALKTAAGIHSKYTSGRFSPTGRSSKHSGVSQRFLSDRPLSKSSLSPRSTPARDMSPHSLAKSKSGKQYPQQPSLPSTSPNVKRAQTSTTQETTKSVKDLMCKKSEKTVDDVDTPSSSSRLKPSPKRNSSDVIGFKGARRTSVPVSAPSQVQVNEKVHVHQTPVVDLQDRHQVQMKDVKSNLERRGSDRVLGATNKLTSGHLVRRSSEYSPVIGSHRGPKLTQAQNYSSYKGITNLNELQTLLTKTEDSAERNKIRNVIRQLRQLPDVEQLKKGKPPASQASGPLSQESETTVNSDRSRTALTSSSHLRSLAPQSAGTTRSIERIKSDNKLDNSPFNEPAHYASTSFTAETLSSPTPSRLGTTQKDGDRRPSATNVALTRNHAASLDVSADSAVNLSVKANGKPSTDTHHELTAPRDRRSGSVPVESPGILEQVKAKLDTRRTSLNIALKTPDRLASPLIRSSATPDSGKVFRFPETRRSSAIPDKSLRRGSSGGEKYREARQHILQSSGIIYESPLAKDRQLVPPRVQPIPAPRATHEHKLGEYKKTVALIQATDEPKSSNNSRSHPGGQLTDQAIHRNVKIKSSSETPTQDHARSVLAEEKPGAPTDKSAPSKILQTSVSLQIISRGESLQGVTLYPATVTNEVNSLLLCQPTEGRKEIPLRRVRSLHSPDTSQLYSTHKDMSQTTMSSETHKDMSQTMISSKIVTETNRDVVIDLELKQIDVETSATVGQSGNSRSSTSLDPANISTVSITTETLELPSKPTLTRARPVARSLTESRLTRPDKYRDGSHLARIEENAELQRDHENHQQPQPVARQRKVGVIMTQPALEAAEDDQSITRHPGYGLRMVTQDPAESSHLNNLLRDFQIQKPVDEESLIARMKRFSAPVSNYVQSQMVAQAEDTGQSKRRHSEIYNKQEAVKIEQAFTSLLEDLDGVSGSESTISDHDLRGSDESLASSSDLSPSRGSIQKAAHHKEAKALTDITLSNTVISDVHNDRLLIPSCPQTDNDTVDHRVDASHGYAQHVENLFLDLSSLSKEDSGIVVSPIELITPHQDNANEDQLEAVVSLLTTSTISQVSSTDVPTSIEALIMTGERLDNREPQSAMDTAHTTTAVIQLTPTAQTTISQETVGTRTFHINHEKDGAVTLQASAEDENQNKVVTVRTLKQRTPSDASEELRDKIIQKKMVSPGGTVLEEKAVVQTKTKLTSRGSNYYTRSTYLTRTKRDKHGQETVEHNVSVETENKSVSQGQSWGNRVTTSVTLDEGGNPVAALGENGRVVTSEVTGDKQRSDSVPKIALVSPTEIIEAITSVKVEGPPEITQPLSDVTSLEGKHVMLSCCIRSAQAPLVTWYKNDVEITQADLYACQYDASDGKATLRIPDATIFDTARYCVVCQNSLGEARTKCSVVIKRRFESVPTIATPLSDLSIGEGHSVHLSCSISGAAIISWFKDGTLLTPSADVQQSYDGQEARLDFSDILMNDAGIYECVATNDCGESSTSCTLTVIASGSDNTVVPMFLTKFSDVQVLDGEALQLDCEVIGSPEPNIFWLKDGRDLPTDMSFSSSFDGRVSCLQIHDIHSEDSGIYKCIAENSAGKISLEARVTVLAKKAPQFLSKLENISIAVGKGIILRCTVAGTPLPSVSWKKDSVSITASQKYIQSYHNGVSRLEILQATSQDAGSYECVATNAVAEAVCSCRVTVLDPEAQRSTEAPKDDLVVETLPKVSRPRTFKKLSEPRPADIITAVIQRASSLGLQRTQSFGPSTSSFTEIHSNEEVKQPDVTPTPQLNNVNLTRASDVKPSTNNRPDSLVQLPKTNVTSRSLTSLDMTPKTDHLSPLAQPAKVPNLGRSVSMHVVRNNALLSPDGHVTAEKVAWSPRSQPRETIGKATSLEIITESKPLQIAPGLRSVSPLTSPDKDKTLLSSMPRHDVSNGHDAATRSTLKPELAISLPPVASSSIPTSGLHPPNKISWSQSNVSLHPASPSLPTNTSHLDIKEPAATRDSTGAAQLPKVSQLRLHFLQNDQLAGQQSRVPASSGGGVKRWHSLPPQDTRPNVVRRDKSTLPTPSIVTMPSYDDINDEEELHKLMNNTEDFEERKKIRTRLREIRDKQRDDLEAKRKQREAETEDLVKKKFEKAEEEKKKKMEAYKQQAPTHERDSKYHEVTQNLIADKYKAAEEDKAKKLAAYTHIGETTGPGGDKTISKTTTTSSTEKTPGGTRTTTTTKVETSTKGFGGTSYAKPAEVTAQELAQRLVNASGPGVSGRITVRTESWNSSDGRVEKSEKSQSWGAKPQGAQNAMAAFKQMDNANTPAGAKPKANLARSPSAIKQVLLDWTKAMTRGYPNVEITNFSSSWNNGMAFCALIHHFYPNAFDFNSLDPAKRRYNFTLAFDTAEKEADIAPLLDVEDMVKMKNPDWKCVFTYVQSIYRHLKDHENNKANPIEQ